MNSKNKKLSQANAKEAFLVHSRPFQERAESLGSLYRYPLTGFHKVHYDMEEKRICRVF
jgi:hypothetical protein